jgi:hypothetical protein
MFASFATSLGCQVDKWKDINQSSQFLKVITSLSNEPLLANQ